MKDSNCALEALAAEAKRRGITYGKLMQITTAWERAEIVERFEEKNKGGK